MSEWAETTLEEVILNTYEEFFRRAQGDKQAALMLASERTIHLLAEIGRLQKEVQELKEAREKVLGTND